jgi:hypothetical protein
MQAGGQHRGEIQSEEGFYSFLSAFASLQSFSRGIVVKNQEVIQRIEQVSDVLVCAQEYDTEVLSDLHRWFNHLFRQSCRSEKIATAAVSCAASRIVEKMLIENAAGVDSDKRMLSNREEIRVQLVNEVDRALSIKTRHELEVTV